MSKCPPLTLKVWGNYACFTRPEMKVERVSYPILTPSAARGILEAIFWKPEFSWLIKEIHVLNEIRHFSILRNEVKRKAVFSTAKQWPENEGGFFADDDRTQRHSLVLRDVAYLIVADIKLAAPDNNGVAKYRDMFRRRVNKGQYFHHPYLGCREFEANFGWPEDDDTPIDYSDDLGLMLHDIKYDPDESGRGKPIFFNARIVNGILEVAEAASIRTQGGA